MSISSAANDSYAACEFVSERDAIAAEVVTRQFAAFPVLQDRYGEAGQNKWREDAHRHILFLAEAVASGSPVLFYNYVAWLKSLLLGLGLSTDDITNQFSILAEVLAEYDNSGETKIAVDYLRSAPGKLSGMPSQPKTHFQSAGKYSELAATLLDNLLKSRRKQAVQLVDAAIGEGSSIAELYLEVFQPLLREVGRLWQMNRLSVAQEHYCTAAVQLIMGRIASDIFATERVGYTMLAACVGDELHEIGVRMVSDFFEMAGWDSHFLGADVPTRDMLDMLIDTHADVVCLSTTVTSHLPSMRKIIVQIRAEPALSRLKILVGGYPFNVQHDLWRRLGADGCAADARAAVELCGRLMDK